MSRKSLPVFLGALALGLSACTPAEEPAPMPVSSPKASEAPAPPPTSQPAPPSGSPEPKPGASQPPAVPPEDDACGAAKLTDYLNRLPTDDVTTGIAQTVGHDRIRTIKPGDAVTMDFRPDRLNVEIGEDGRIQRIRCG